MIKIREINGEVPNVFYKKGDKGDPVAEIPEIEAIPEPELVAPPPTPIIVMPQPTPEAKTAMEFAEEEDEKLKRKARALGAKSLQIPLGGNTSSIPAGTKATNLISK